MTRSKKKKLKVLEMKSLTDEEEVKKIPIDNLPDNYLWMHIKSGTKIRNVLEYAFKHFPIHNSIVWTGVDQSINKTISCSQLFKRQYPKLHQVTRLRYVLSDKKSSKSENSDKKSNKYVPEIHILLTENPIHVKDPGYQGPEDTGDFADLENSKEPGKIKDPSYSRQCEAVGSSKVTSLAVEEFAAMGLRTGVGKRSRQEQQSNETPFKKNKTKESNLDKGR